MKFNKKYIYGMAVLGLGMGVLTSCSDKDDYSPGNPVNGDEVYFPSNVQTYFALGEETNTFVVAVNRLDDTEALTVPIEVYPSDDNSLTAAFTFPASVTFAAGESTTEFVVTYDISMFIDDDGTIDYDDEQQFTLEINDGSATPYGTSVIDITAEYPSPWTILGKVTVGDDGEPEYTYGTYTDESWGVNNEDDTAEVLFWVNDLDPDLYRIEYPYQYTLAGERPEYIQFRILRPGDKIGNVTVPNNLGVTLVYYPDFPIAYHSNYEEDVYALFPGRFMSFDDPKTWVYNYVVDWQEPTQTADGKTVTYPGEIHLSPYYFLFGQSGGWNETTGEPITIIFPGYENLETTVEVTYSGLLNKADDTLEVLAEVELGKDVTSAKVAVVSGSTPSAAQLSGIQDGTIESVEITETGEVRIPFASTNPAGKYSIVAISYYEEGARNSDYSTFTYTPGTPETWSFVTEGLYTYLQYWETNLGLEPEILELYESDSTPGRFKITHWFYDEDFIFTLNNDGSIYVEEEQPTGVSTANGPVWVDDFSLWGDDAEPGLEDGVYYFAVMYYNGNTGGWYAYGYESFEPVTVGTSAVKLTNSTLKSRSNTKLTSRRINIRPTYSSTIRKKNFQLEKATVVAQ